MDCSLYHVKTARSCHVPSRKRACPRNIWVGTLTSTLPAFRMLRNKFPLLVLLGVDILLWWPNIRLMWCILLPKSKSPLSEWMDLWLRTSCLCLGFSLSFTVHWNHLSLHTLPTSPGATVSLWNTPLTVQRPAHWLPFSSSPVLWCSTDPSFSTFNQLY